MFLILGGARSGKSTFAEQKAKALQQQLDTNVLYIATAIAFDKDMQDRIKKHQEARPDTWHTLEKYSNFAAIDTVKAFVQSDVILLDCMTLLISNQLLEAELDFDKVSWEVIDALEKQIFKQVDDLLQVCVSHRKRLIIVANEVGLGIVPAYRLGSIFRDIAGRMNQYLAKQSEEVYLLTAGIPLKIKDTL